MLGVHQRTVYEWPGPARSLPHEGVYRLAGSHGASSQTSSGSGVTQHACSAAHHHNTDLFRSANLQVSPPVAPRL